MFRCLIGLSLLFAISANAQNENVECENYYERGSDKPSAMCEYDFGKEKNKFLISKECILKKCEAYKAYEKAFTIRNVREPGDMDHNWGTLNCMNLKGSLTWLSNNRQISGEELFCKFNDSSYVETYYLNTSRTLW